MDLFDQAIAHAKLIIAARPVIDIILEDPYGAAELIMLQNVEIRELKAELAALKGKQ